MIVKKITNPKKSASKAARIGGLANYIVEPQRENGAEKCIFREAQNFLTTDHDAQISEMIALASEAIKSKDPIDHWVLSWRADEQPTVEQAREAVNIFVEHCGLRGHQFIWGMHDDTKNPHVHIEVNRVHPDTLKVMKINKGFDREAGQQIGALIEHSQGWQPEKGSRYEVVNGKPVMRDSMDKDKPLKPSIKAQDMELQTGEKSAQRTGIEEAAPIIAAARTWYKLHESLKAAGMRYERKGSGAIIFVGDQPIKASDVSRAASLSALQKRFGAFQPAKEISPNEYHHHRVVDRNQATQQNLAALGKEPAHHLQNLSECRMAVLSEEQQAKRAGVLHVDARPDRPGTGGLRRETGRGTNDNDQSQRQRLPLKPNQPGWSEYQTLNAELKAAKGSATIDLQNRQQAQRDALFEKQKAERAEIFTPSWRGSGMLRNAMLSTIATRHAAEKLELREQQQAERQAIREQYRPLPQYKTWKEQPQIVSHTTQIEVKPVQQPQISKLLMSLRQSPDLRGYFTYRSGDVALFRDEGKTIAVLDQSSRSIAAALAVAQQKYGQTLTLSGDDAFKRKAVAAAVEHGLSVKFADPALETLRVKMIEDKRHAERDARQAAVREAQAAGKAEEETAEQNPAVATVLDAASPNQSAPEARAFEVQVPFVLPALPTPLLPTSDWLANQSKPVEPPRRGNGTVYVAVHVSDGIVLDHGRTLAVYPLQPGLIFTPGQRVVINKDGSLAPATTHEHETEKGR